ncbi:catabolic alanine racemase DadX [Mangrovibacter phragmitis]|uniref:catabolic alanine racemase DadX n=1 Tax=Mangrovibacter phragmitis TaxID=1691903 RepID=UPI003517CC75
MTRPINATIDLQAISHNLHQVRQQAGHAKVWSVVKADAYGHGLKRIWSTLASGTDGFALLNIEDALWLRQAGWHGPVLLLEGFFDAGELALCHEYGLTTCVHSNWQLAMLAASPARKPVNVYLKVNSGMNRLGFCPEEVNAVWQQLQSLAQVGEVTLMAHFAKADQPGGTGEAMRLIRQAAEGLNLPRSLANSAAVLWCPETHYDWVRPGIILYGASPSARPQDIAPFGLRPAMTLQSQIIGIQHLNAGDTVGYGCRYHATKTQRIGIVAAGYADGYPRTAPDATPVWVDGVLTTLTGAVSMDMLAVDLTPCPHANIGSPVELWGQNVPVDDVAQAAGTIGYELLCALAPRVPVVTV